MWQIEGQDNAVGHLIASLERDRLSHAYLLVGPPQVGKFTAAIKLAQSVNCLNEEYPCGSCKQCERIALSNHPDVRILGFKPKSGKNEETGIDDIRDLEHQAFLQPYEGRCRVFILDNADRMTVEASNALLKILEDPPPQCLFILISPAEQSLLPTIRSRCSKVEFATISENTIRDFLMDRHQVDKTHANKLARLSRGRIGWAINTLENPMILQRRETEITRLLSLMDGTLEQRFHTAAEVADLFYNDRPQAKVILEVWVELWRDILLIKEGSYEFLYNEDIRDSLYPHVMGFSSLQITNYIKCIIETVRSLDSNANARLALEVLMLQMPNAETTGII